MNRADRWVALFTALYMAAFTIPAIAYGNREFIFYAVVMLVLVALLLFAHRRCGLSTGVLWALAFWGLMHMAGGTVRIPDSWPREGVNTLYNLRPRPWLPKYDQATHAYGFGVATLASYQMLSAAVLGKGRRLPMSPGLGVALVCIGMGLGALNEVVEFVAVLSMPHTNVGGYVNTGWDLVSNLVGCMLAAGWIAFNARRQPLTLPAEAAEANSGAGSTPNP